jgi:hypothetical protein
MHGGIYPLGNYAKVGVSTQVPLSALTSFMLAAAALRSPHLGAVYLIQDFFGDAALTSRLATCGLVSRRIPHRENVFVNTGILFISMVVHIKPIAS